MTKRAFRQYMNFGWTLLGGMLVLTFGGYYLDQKNETNVWTLTGTLLGIIYCGYLIWKLIQDQNKP